MPLTFRFLSILAFSLSISSPRVNRTFPSYRSVNFRLYLACFLCRSSKRECTVSSPCDHCLKRGRVADCRYPGERRNATTTEHASLATVIVPRISQREPPSGEHQNANSQAMGDLADGADEQMTQILETLSPDNISFVPPRVLENAQKTKGNSRVPK